MEIEEPMDVDISEDFDKFDDLLEEGEYRESNHISRKMLPSIVSVPEIRYENKAGTFVTGIDIFSKEVKMKMEERAKRFGIVNEAEKSVLKESDSLYISFGISEENIKNFRLNVVHMRGTENMKTKDVFKYFEDYVPSSIEWINDISCNVVWLDKQSAARAILGLSKKIIDAKKESNHRIHSDDESNEDPLDDQVLNGKHCQNENAIHVKDIRCPLPPGIWRKGNNCADSRNIFLRFATRSDRKQVHDEKMKECYKKDINQGGLKGILTSSRKRIHKQLKESSPTLKLEPNTNGIAAKNPWGSLSKNWGVTDFVEDDYLPKAVVEPVSNIKERLGFKTQEKEDIEENLNIIEVSDESQFESSSEEENWCKRSKMPRMRMHADDEEEKIQKRKGKIRDMVSHSAKIMDNDLRGKLTAKRRRIPPVYHEAIQVVVTNPKAVKTNFTDVNVTEDEDEDEDEEDVQEVIVQDEENNEEEEGEIVDDSGSDSKVEYEEGEEGVEVEEESELESDNGSSESSVSEKEVQGPKGSVIKVVQHKPKLASTVSTVWSRLNHSKIDRNDDTSQERYYSKTDLRFTLRKNDLRSRIGNHHMRGRSPLRIELRNDKYAGRENDSE